MLIKGAVFAMEGTFGGVFVAKKEVMHFDFFGRPIEGRAAVESEVVDVVIALAVDALPLRLGGFEDEIVGEGVFGIVVTGGDVVVLAPAVKEEEPGGFGFAGEDEGFGASAVFGEFWAERATPHWRASCRGCVRGVRWWRGGNGGRRVRGSGSRKNSGSGGVPIRNFFVRLVDEIRRVEHSELIVRWRRAG